MDEAAHSVQLYTDTTAEWVSGAGASIVKWSTQDTGGSIYHEIVLQSPEANIELRHQAQDGQAYYAAPAVSIL